MALIYFQVSPGFSALELRLAAVLALDLFPAIGRATAVQARARMTGMRILTESLQTSEKLVSVGVSGEQDVEKSKPF